MKKFSIFVCCLMIVMSACGTSRKEPAQTQMQLRQLQTRTYDTADTKMVMKAMLNVLQDDDFMVKQANVDLGLLSATKEKDIESEWTSFWGSIAHEDRARWKKISIIECTANVSEYGKQTRVRVTFKEKILDNHGDAMKIRKIQDAKFYQDFFSKVSKGIFIQSEEL